jgi:hypothetical protein
MLDGKKYDFSCFVLLVFQTQTQKLKTNKQTQTYKHTNTNTHSQKAWIFQFLMLMNWFEEQDSEYKNLIVPQLFAELCYSLPNLTQSYLKNVTLPTPNVFAHLATLFMRFGQFQVDC